MTDFLGLFHFVFGTHEAGGMGNSVALSIFEMNPIRMVSIETICDRNEQLKRVTLYNANFSETGPVT